MSHYNDPQESTPYEDVGLIDLARVQLNEEFEEASTQRVSDFLSSLEVSELVYMWYCKQKQLGHHLDHYKEMFVERYLYSEIDAIIENSKMDAAKAYADYLEDR